MRALLDDLRRGLRAALDDGLLGLHVCGSLTGEDFDERVSDIDTVAVTHAPLTEHQLAALANMHVALLRHHVAWEDRIEVVYVSRAALATRGPAAYPTAVISPGEPLHLLTDPPDDDQWLLNWHELREHSVTLHGPSPETLIAPITAAQVRARMRTDLAGWPTRVRRSPARHPGWQAYAILTVCRSACTLHTGRKVSKKAGAEWGKRVWPAHAAIIDRAVGWRQEQHRTEPRQDEHAYPQTIAFVEHAARHANDPRPMLTERQHTL